MDALFEFIVKGLSEGSARSIIIVLALLLVGMGFIIFRLDKMLAAKDLALQAKDAQLQDVYVHLMDKIKETHDELGNVLSESMDQQRDFSTSLVSALHHIDNILTELKTHVVLQSQRQIDRHSNN